MIYEEITQWSFANRLLNDDYASWSQTACDFLYDYYSELDEDWELDLTEIRSEWTEIEKGQPLIDAYPELIDMEDYGKGEDAIDDAVEDLINCLQYDHEVYEIDNGCVLIHE